MEDLNPKCVARCKEFSVEPLVTSQVIASGCQAFGILGALQL